MNGLIIYYSRTGRTRKVAEFIQDLTGYDLEEIKENSRRLGLFGWLKSGMESTRRMLPQIMPLTLDPLQYDIVIIGTPIWASNMSSPLRTFLKKYREKIKKYALFCTGDGVEPTIAFKSISELLRNEPQQTLGLVGDDRKEEIASLRITEFVSKLRGKTPADN
jgi:flavodoxin